ncbi:MAG: translation initiation factor IF-2 [bacterium]|nr:translation initiation factor IF-2 [bacterium]
MKAIDIATKNHVTIEDTLEVCKELGIKYENGNSELSDQDVFLIEKKIEVIKTKKIQKAAQAKKGKKIKLKRKVHIGKDKKEKAAAETTDKKGKPEKKVTEPAPSAKDKAKPERDKEQKGKPKKAEHKGKPSKERPSDKKAAPRKGAPEKGAPGSDKKPESLEKSEFSKKRKKGKEKEKDNKKKFKKIHEEKQLNFRKKDGPPKKKEATTPEEISITESLSVGDLAKKLNVKANEVIGKLMKLGVMATINQAIDSETAAILAGEYNTEVKVVSLFDETVIKHNENDREEDYQTRSPIVTIMGHVDHGKTKLLDAIRKTNVADGEFGGITQHIGAYKVHLGQREIAFLDTPGHAAFTTMRARGASITDIVILVVAANDGVMPQTIEAIDHAKDAGVPIIVAINKIDLPDANIAKVKQELANYELAPEEWGGTTLYAEISAKQEINIDGLLELILIQSEMLELKANSTLRAKGTVIESKLDSGRGAVSTILIQNGIIKVGDPFVVGVFSGKVRAMFDDQGRSIKSAGPSTPVEVLGITGIPAAGDPFEGVESERFAKQISQKRLEYKRIESAKKVKKVTLESLNEMIREGEVQELRTIVKADVDGSAQALTEALEKLTTVDIRVKVIHTGTGGINESDVMLASASNAIIIGFHVRPTGRVAEIAEKENVAIEFYNIIFEATDSIKAAMEGMLSPEIQEKIQGTGDVKQIFKISKLGTVAGAICLTGKIERKSKMRLIRDGVVIFDGDMKSLKRFKDDVNEVSAGQEFGFAFESFNDIKEGDAFESYKLIEVAKTL